MDPTSLSLHLSAGQVAPHGWSVGAVFKPLLEAGTPNEHTKRLAAPVSAFHLPYPGVVRKKGEWSKMTLNYRMMVERYPNLKEEVSGSNPGCEISSLLNRILARWSIASCALELACQPSV